MRGNVTAVSAIIIGMITLVVGAILSTTVISQFATSGSNANIGSFSGAQAVNDLVPLLWFVMIVTVALGLIGGGVAGLAGRGPLARS